MNQRAIIIAEAGVNHNGDLGLAYKMIENAAAAGADIIKFQTISKETNYNFAIKDEAVYGFIESASFTKEQYASLKLHCERKNIGFLSSAADIPAAKLLYSLNVSGFKVSSGNFTNYHLIDSLISYNLPMIISTGMSNAEEINETYEFINRKGYPMDKLALLYCVSEYPAKYSNIDLNRMVEIKKRYPNITVGFSDHSEGIVSSVLARSLGAMIIEKHFTLDKAMEGPDQAFSLDTAELKFLVDCIRQTEEIMFSNKMQNAGEDQSKNKIRRSLYYNKDLPANHVLRYDDFAAKRPFNAKGISPKNFERVVGQKLVQNVKINQVVTKENFI